jgi:hypothetical protein
MNNIMPYFINGLKSAKCTSQYEDNNLVVSIRDININEKSQLACILINATDKRKVDPTFENTSNGFMRTIKKRKGEGISVSAHLIIDLIPHSGINNYLCLCEHTDGISKTMISSFLDVLSRKLHPGIDRFDSSQKKDIKVLPKLRFEVIDDSIEKDIKKGGNIKEIIFENLIKKGDGLDENKWVESISEKVIFRVKKENGTQFNKIKNFIKTKMSEKAKYNTIKIIYKTSQDKQRVTALEHKKDSAIEFSFGKAIEVDLSSPIEASALAKIDSGLYDKMKKIILKERTN